MKRTLIFSAVSLLGALLVTLALGSPSAAQARAADRVEVDSLIDRIKSARTRDEKYSGEQPAEKPSLVAPGETKPKAPAATAEKKPVDRLAEERARAEFERSIKDPLGYSRSLGAPSRADARDSAGGYHKDGSVEDLLSRIRASRSEESQSEKERREKDGKDIVTRETTPVDTRSTTPDASSYQRFISPGRNLSGTVGGQALVEGARNPTGVAEVRDAAKPAAGGDLPDPSKNTDLYQEKVKQDYGITPDLPRYADKGLMGVYQADEYSRMVSNQRDVRFDPNAKLSTIFRTYQDFQRSPDTGSIIGRRDVYVSGSSGVTPSRVGGGIYDTPYASDPYRRNSSSSTSSQYSSSGYFNLGTRESFQDYYTREYGVSRNFVPDFSSSRGFEVNTIKQWSQDLRTNYGVDIRPGDATYGDLYRMRTGARVR